MQALERIARMEKKGADSLCLHVRSLFSDKEAANGKMREREENNSISFDSISCHGKYCKINRLINIKLLNVKSWMLYLISAF